MHLDAIEAVTDVTVDAENALQVHSTLERRLHRAKLDVAVLCDSCDSGGQATGEPREHDLHRRRTLVLGGKNFRVVGIEPERGAVLLLLAEAEEALYSGCAVRSVDPVTGCAPRELRRLGRLGQGFPRAQQCFDVDSVVDGSLGGFHWVLLLCTDEIKARHVPGRSEQCDPRVRLSVKVAVVFHAHVASEKGPKARNHPACSSSPVPDRVLAICLAHSATPAASRVSTEVKWCAASVRLPLAR